MNEHLLITGSTGAVGRHLLPLLLRERPEREITVIVRDPSRAPAQGHVRVIAGDISQPGLGLEGSARDALARRVTAILHCAADVRFDLPLHEARRANAQGTRHVIELGRSAPRLTKLLHVSTTFIMGRDAGELAEFRYSNESGFVNSYEQAKYEAEAEVFAFMPEVPAAIVRPASLTGTGGYIEQTLRLIPRYPFPVVPADHSARLDLVPVAWAARAIAVLFDRCFRPGGVDHVCAGLGGSIPVGEALELAWCAMDAESVPKSVGLRAFEDYRDQALRNGEREITKKLLRSVSQFLPHLAIRQTFRNDNTLAMLAQQGVPPASSRDALVAVLAGLAHVPVPAGEAVR